MNFFAVGNGLGDMFRYAWIFFIRGGWVLFIFGLSWMTLRLYMNRINSAFIASHDWVFIQIKVERENLQSTLAVEQIFTQLHAIHSGFNWAQVNLEGAVQMWLSLEIVSIGGKISYIIKTPKKYLHLVESAFYAQYPNAEIREVEDYMKNLSHWDAEKSSWDMWGTEYKMIKDFAYPIKTYQEFEHPAAEEAIIDPLAGILEAMGKIEPYELMAIQYIIRPEADLDWQPHIAEVVKEIKKEAVHKTSIWERLFFPIHAAGKKTIFEMISESGEQGHGDESNAPIMQRLSEGEKKVLLAVENKMTRPAWRTKIRTLYIAPKDKYDGTKKTSLIGGFRQFSGVVTNSLKPDLKGTWTSYNYNLSKKLEAPLVDFEIQHKKHKFLDAYVRRSYWVGAPYMIMNAEELATIFHFPLARTSTPPVERIDIKKGQPPANLPVMG
jgi:hypothetical protein